MFLSLLPLLLLLVASACFSASETAFFNLTALQRQQMSAAPGRRERLVADLLKRPDQILVTLLLPQGIVGALQRLRRGRTS